MSGETIDGQWVRRWLNTLQPNIPFAELAVKMTDDEILAWFMSLYDRPDSGMWTLRLSSIDVEKMK